MKEKIKIFYGSLGSSAGTIFKSMQMVQLPSLEEMEEQTNNFIANENITVISIRHEVGELYASVLVHYKEN